MFKCCCCSPQDKGKQVGLRKCHSSFGDGFAFGLCGITEYPGRVIFRYDFQLLLLLKNLPSFCQVIGKVDFSINN